jgi:hypothetical protein
LKLTNSRGPPRLTKPSASTVDAPIVEHQIKIGPPPPSRHFNGRPHDVPTEIFCEDSPFFDVGNHRSEIACPLGSQRVLLESLRFVNRPRLWRHQHRNPADVASMPPFRGRHARPRTLELKVVSDRVRRDVARRPVDAAAVAGRRAAKIESLDRRARSR